MNAIPSSLVDKELGIQPSQEVEQTAADAQLAQQDSQTQHTEQADHDVESSPIVEADHRKAPDQADGNEDISEAQSAQQAKQAGLDGEPKGEEEGRERLPLFTHKVMALMQHMLKYKVRKRCDAADFALP